MKYGFNLLLWTTHVTAEHVPLFAKLKAAGYDGVELPLFEGDAAHFKTVRKAQLYRGAPFLSPQAQGCPGKIETSLLPPGLPPERPAILPSPPAGRGERAG